MRLRLATIVMCSVLALSLIFLFSSLSLSSVSMTMTMADDFGSHRDGQSIDLWSNSTTVLLRYFGYNDSSNVGLITWAHAVNSQRLFREAVVDKLDFLEADILLRGGVGGTPIMAHPPDVDSDLTLSNFLEQSFPLRIGIKLDFKTIDALRGSVSVLATYWTRRAILDVALKCPLWMNADIVGHGYVESGKVDADEFLAMSRRVAPDANLSVGWNIHGDYFINVESGESLDRLSFFYSEDDVKRMRDALFEHVSSEQSVTFAVWAKFIIGSNDTLKWLTDQFPRSTLTIWGKESDATVEELKSVYKILPKSRVFLDLPDRLREGLLSVGSQ